MSLVETWSMQIIGIILTFFVGRNTDKLDKFKNSADKLGETLDKNTDVILKNTKTSNQLLVEMGKH